MTRREFLGYGVAAGAMGAGVRLSSPLGASPTSGWIVSAEPGECSLPESAQGYRAALLAEGATASHGGPCSLLIIPALLCFDRRLVVWIDSALERGATVIVESGAAFATDSGFRDHRQALHEGLQLDVLAPIRLWNVSRSERIPYVDYTWPHRAKVRDFSRMVPVGNQAGEVIAWIGDVPVALKRRVGRGTLIYLGSPLGPALWAGDAEARRWLHAIALNDFAMMPSPPARSTSMTSVSNSEVEAK